MHKFIAGIVAAGLTLTSCGSMPLNLVAQQGVVKSTLAQMNCQNYDYSSLNDFSASLWSAAANDTTNALSPLSAYIALAMCANGAAGDTFKEFSLLGFKDGDNSNLNSMAAQLIEELTAEDSGIQLNIANSIWSDEKFSVKADYLQTLMDYYSAEIFSVDLQSSKDEINSWIEDKTNGLIKDMLGEINPEEVLLLINTLYMNADWEVEFNSLNTHEGDFYGINGTRTEEYMNHTGSIKTVDSDFCYGVVLPYKGGRLEFCALMPTDKNMSTSELVSLLNGDNSVTKLAKSAVDEQVILSLPKFEVKSTLELNDILQEMGLVSMFSKSADFSVMSDDSDDLAVSDVLQNIYICVDEQGTEAAAATTIIMGNLAMPINNRKIVFDRPFVWAVYDNVSGAILFCGEYN